MRISRWLFRAILFFVAVSSPGCGLARATGTNEARCEPRVGDTGYSGMTSVFEVDGGEPRIRLIEITPGSPAEKAGLAAGDKVVEIDGHPLPFRSQYEWGYRYRSYRPGDVLELTVLHEGRSHAVRLKLGEPTPEWRKKFLHGLVVEELKEGAAGSRLLDRRSVNGPIEVTLRRDSSCRLEGELAGKPNDRPFGLAAALRIIPLVDHLRPGDSLTLRVTSSGGSLSIDPVTIPSHLGAADVLAAVRETLRLRNQYGY